VLDQPTRLCSQRHSINDRPQRRTPRWWLLAFDDNSPHPVFDVSRRAMRGGTSQLFVFSPCKL